MSLKSIRTPPACLRNRPTDYRSYYSLGFDNRVNFYWKSLYFNGLLESDVYVPFGTRVRALKSEPFYSPRSREPNVNPTPFTLIPALSTTTSTPENNSRKGNPLPVTGRKLPGGVARFVPMRWTRRTERKGTGPYTPGRRSIALEPHGDPDYLPDGHEFSQEWIRLFEKFNFSTEKDLIRARGELEAQKQTAIQFVGERDTRSLREAWLDMPLHHKSRNLAFILIGCLADSARRTLTMLSILKVLPRGWKVRCECLLCIEQVYWDEVQANPDLQELFAGQIKLVSKVWTWPDDVNPFPRAFLALLLRHNNHEHCENIIDTVLQNYDPVPASLILVMVDHYTRTGNANQAIELLWRIPARERERWKVAILQRFKNLMRLETIGDPQSDRNFKILPRLIEFGLGFDESVHNAVLQRAIQLHSPQVAWEIYDFMEAENICVHADSHLALLKDSFIREERPNLEKVMWAIHQREDLFRNPYLVAYMMNILRVACRIENQTPETALSHILAIYDRAYDRAPLIRLGLADPLPVGQTAPTDLPEPSPAGLAFTLWAYVLIQSRERHVSKLWYRIVHLIQHHDRGIIAAARHDLLYHGFISFFCRSPSTLQKSLDVVGEMIKLNLCKPTARTWSELICGFLSRGEEGEAEKIWQAVLAEGVQPSKIDWSYLLRRHDNTLLAQKIRDAIDERRMPEGTEPVPGQQEKATAGATDTHVASAEERGRCTRWTDGGNKIVQEDGSFKPVTQLPV
ncbi:uncharacterized protein Z518_01076 [Rhinocladiella mackenziei CBS 650.93]|uniref:Pentatricopeptide repeat protein n=1 Tax=Rhinocladiella mackenziei CBS 650.93 TaxID=1442369 RepID=A0A0D2JKL1_9EURO|nr:uncharacterized protein Z518_01076 [Rhinocladiella mackenziei CBS 650.93]KIX09995.1 hypothetical protein Z518_01076 [Rhinocladiella mackenziei CBS 650.93]